MNLAENDNPTPSLRTAENKLESRRFRLKDKSDYSALEMVLDNKTKHLIAEMAASGAISHVVATVSSGKEAVVFSAEVTPGHLAALKIFKHGAMDFRRREKYFAGDRRFDNHQLRSNPRKMVKLWAEKEYRNLKLLTKFGLPSPKPLHLRHHILMMELVTSGEGVASSTLKDYAEVAEPSLGFYKQAVHLLRRMYNECHLVHADFSEYNLLVGDGGVIYVIDLGSGVSVSHPNAKKFLLRDCYNIRTFFKRNKICPLTLSEIFRFVVKGLNGHTGEKEKNKFSDFVDHRLSDDAKNDFERETDDFEIKLSTLQISSLFDLDEDDAFNSNSKEIVHHLVVSTSSELEENSEVDADEAAAHSDSSAEVAPGDGSRKPKKEAKCKEQIRRERKENKIAVKGERREKIKVKTRKKVKRRRDKLVKLKKGGVRR